mgnify:CR=1 FL=1
MVAQSNCNWTSNARVCSPSPSGNRSIVRDHTRLEKGAPSVLLAGRQKQAVISLTWRTFVEVIHVYSRCMKMCFILWHWKS